MNAPTLPRILMVDDEPLVLAGYRRTAGRVFDLTCAVGGRDGLAAIAGGPPFAVVVTDMRMPEMTGLQFIAAARGRSRESVFMMLTGNADQQTAVDAINAGQIFRFLNKPCPPDQLEAAVRAAVRQHELVTAERVLLRDTLTGTVKLLADALELANPELFAFQSAVKGNYIDLARALGVPLDWQFTVAGTLCLIGLVAVPGLSGDELLSDDALLLAAVTGGRLLAHVPRLAGAAAVIERCRERVALPDPLLPVTRDTSDAIGSQMLRFSMDLTRELKRGGDRAARPATRRGRRAPSRRRRGRPGVARQGSGGGRGGGRRGRRRRRVQARRDPSDRGRSAADRARCGGPAAARQDRCRPADRPSPRTGRAGEGGGMMRENQTMTTRELPLPTGDQPAGPAVSRAPDDPAQILFVDDDPRALNGYRLSLHGAGRAWSFLCETSVDAALARLGREPVDVIVTDVTMPGRDGFDLIRAVAALPERQRVPVVVLTGVADDDLKRRALDAGAADLIGKPVRREDLLATLRSVLRTKAYEDSLADLNATLELKVLARTRELEAARTDLLLCLAMAGECRDADTGKHLIRVARYARRLGEQVGLSPADVEMLFKASPLHDIGKLGIPDRVLLKPGPLDAAERSEMQAHCRIGHRILTTPAGLAQALDGLPEDGARPVNPTLLAAAEIALCHHERWDGTGYPRGLAGEQIPLASRLVAVADVYDALTTRRPYKVPFPHAEAVRVVREGAGSQFDPAVVAAFVAVAADFDEIRAAWADTANRDGDSVVSLPAAACQLAELKPPAAGEGRLRTAG
jgi:putative two-component system response regulator